MTCEYNTWDEKICPYCKYDICGVRYHHNKSPIKGMEMKILFAFEYPISKNFYDKLSLEFTSYIKNNPLMTVEVISCQKK